MKPVYRWSIAGLMALWCGVCSATVSVTVESPTADGWNGSIGTPYETSGSGTFDVFYNNMVGTGYYFKRQFCGGEVATYYTLPNSGSANLGGLTVTLLNGTYGRVYRFSGVPVGSAQAFCFVSQDGYMSATITSTAVAVTPTPVISNLRIVADAAVPGGSKLCVDYTPVNPVITSFSWIENGVTKSTGPSSALWASYVCWDRNEALVQGTNYGLQIKYSGPSGDKFSNYLSILVPVAVTAPGMPTNVTATQNSNAYPGQIYVSWTPGARSTGVGYYLYRYDSNWSNAVWLGWAGNLVSNGPSYLIDTPPQTGVGYHYAVTAYNAIGAEYSPTANTVTPGIALPVPLTCSAAMTGVPQTVTSTTSSVRVSVYGVTNATSVNIALWGDLNGQNDLTTLPATNGGAGTWYVDAPLLSPEREFGAFTARAYLTGAAGTNVPCNSAATVFTRRAPQSSTFVTQTYAGAVNPWLRNFLVNRSYPVSITFMNSGQSTWQHATTAGGVGHKLPSNTPDWGTWTAPLMFPAGSTPPGGTVTASGTITTSATPSFGSFYTTVYDDPIEFLGQTSPTVFVSTFNLPTAPTGLVASDAAFGDRVRLTWARGSGNSQLMLRAAAGTAFPTGGLNGQPVGWSIVCSGLTSTATACDDTTAVSGVVYDYRVIGLAPSDGLDNGGWELGVASGGDTGYALTPITTAPQNLTASSNYADRIQLNWSAFSGAASFELQRTLADTNRTADGAVITATPGSLTATADTSIPRGLGRCYKIRAVNAAGAGPWSNEACGSRMGLAVPALDASQGTVTGATRLTWGAPVGYTATQSGIWRLRIGSNLSDWENIATLQGSPGTFEDASERGADVVADFYLLNQVDGAGNWGHWTMTTVSNYSSNIAHGYANVAPTSLTIPNIAATANAQSPTVTMAVVDPNQAAGQQETFAFSIVSQPIEAQGRCSIVGSTMSWTPAADHGFSGTTSCTVRVTDRGGATRDTVVSITVAAFVPLPPTRVSATDGTVTAGITVAWTGSAGASSYQILRNAVAVGTVSTMTFNDTSVNGTTVYTYTVKAVSASGGISTDSGADAGYANVAPMFSGNPVVGISAAGIGAATLATIPYSDANKTAGQSETFAFAVTGLPATAGAVAVNTLGVLTFTPPVNGSTVADTRTHTLLVTVTDKAGAEAVGNVELTIIGFDNAEVETTNITPPILIATSVENPNTMSIWPSPLGSQFVQFKNNGTTTWGNSYKATYTLTNVAGLSLSATTSLNTQVVSPAAFSVQSAGVGTAQFQPSLAFNKLVSSNALGAATLRVQMVNSAGVNFGEAFTIALDVRALPSCAQATLSVDQTIVRAVTGTMGAKLRGSQFADATTFVVTHVATGLTSQPFTSTSSGTDFVGLLDLAALTPGAPLFGAFVVTALMTNSVAVNGLACSKSATFQREALAPTNVVATQGSVTDQVKVSWTGIPNVGSSAAVTAYDIFACSNNVPPAVGYASTAAGRSIVPSSCSLIGSVGSDTLTFTQTLNDTTEKHRWYAVAGREGPPSALAEGWPNLAPSVTSLSTMVNAFGLAQQLPMPLVSDANSGEQFTISLSDPASGGVASSSTSSSSGVNVALTASGLVYSPVARPPSGAVVPGVAPSVPGVLGSDSFNYWATDRAGASIMGTATLTVCPYPSVSITEAKTGTDPIDVSGAVTRLACNGAVNGRFSLERLGSSITAGTVTGPVSGEFAAQTAFPVTGSSYASGLSFGSSVINRSGRYGLTTIVTDGTGATATSDTFPIDVACGEPQWDITSQKANFKRGVLMAKSTISQNDTCQIGLTYGLDVVRLTQATPTAVYTTMSTMMPDGGAVVNIGDVGSATVTNWTTAMPAQSTSQLGLRLQASTANGVAIASKLAPLSVTCPDPFVSSAAMTARSNLENVEVIVAIAPCAVAVSSVTLTTIGGTPVRLSGSLVAGAASAVYAGQIAYPATEGATTAEIAVTLADGRTSNTSLRIVYDARTATPLYSLQILRGAPGSKTTDSLSRVLLAAPPLPTGDN